jgi:hypothetical protein
MAVENPQRKVAVSVSEMARLVGLSRARFYQLIGTGTFPAPSYDPGSGRPYYDHEQQQAVRHPVDDRDQVHRRAFLLADGSEVGDQHIGQLAAVAGHHSQVPGLDRGVGQLRELPLAAR